jgi:predicted nucleotidyltransferase component of viral defense system
MFELCESMPNATEKLFVALNDIVEMQVWTLVGGTALSLHLRHRTSEDLDFFVNNHCVDGKLNRNIEDIISRLDELHWHSSLTLKEDNQNDYMIGEVRVTFHTTTAIDLSTQPVMKYRDGHIGVCQIETIAAMKMYTILKYRIKSRDFYDLFTLIEDGYYDLNKLVGLLKKYYPKKFFEGGYLEKRLTKAPLNNNDEGLDSLRLNNEMDFLSLRKYFKKLILNKQREESLLLQEMDFSALVHKRFGFDYSTLSIRLAQEGKYQELNAFVDTGMDSKPNEKNLAGKAVFDYILNHAELFIKILRSINYIPDGLVESVKNAGINTLLESINYERLLNRQLKNIDDRETVEYFAQEKNLDIERFCEDLTQKHICIYP